MNRQNGKVGTKVITLTYLPFRKILYFPVDNALLTFGRAYKKLLLKNLFFLLWKKSNFVIPTIFLRTKLAIYVAHAIEAVKKNNVPLFFLKKEISNTAIIIYLMRIIGCNDCVYYVWRDLNKRRWINIFHLNCWGERQQHFCLICVSSGKLSASSPWSGRSR